MPKSKHRKKPFTTAVQRQAKEDKGRREADARRRVYDLALPQRQDYPPVLREIHDHKRERPQRHLPSKAITFYEVSRMRSGQVFKDARGREYQKQIDGSIRRVSSAIEMRKAA